ncbi:MAG: hypothetical protein IJ131_01615 [Eggerthellaceae bacterium]|nr:hypothetical protein [Eggerthellaceae bacterium]
MKKCPICGGMSFDDAQTCFGCMHRFDAQDDSEERGEEHALAEPPERFEIPLVDPMPGRHAAPACDSQRSGTPQEVVRPHFSREPALLTPRETVEPEKSGNDVAPALALSDRRLSGRATIRKRANAKPLPGNNLVQADALIDTATLLPTLNFESGLKYELVVSLQPVCER